MIIRKPYAFLIKNFRLIHGFLFIMLLYLFLKTASIYSFFSDYVANGHYTKTGSIESMYVNYFMFIICIIVLLGVFIVYYLLSVKKKNNKIYLAMFIFYIILFVYFIYMYSSLKGLNEEAMSIPTRTLMVDLSVMALVPQVVFMFMTVGRILGFNLKQFDFKSDLAELNIDESDNEEVEITLGNDSYKIARFLRKLLRLSKYFILENKIFVIGCSSIIVLVLSLTIYTRLNVYNISYTENQAILASSLKYTVKESYITNSDLNNSIIESGKSFVLVKLNIVNEANIERTLDRDSFILESGKESLSPSFTYDGKFIDLGETFAPTEIKSGTDNDYIVIFQINDEDIKKDYNFKIKNIRTSIANIDSAYKEILIKPVNLDKIKDMGNKKIDERVLLDNLIFKSSYFTLSSYDIKEKFTEDWNYCTNSGVCRKNGVYTIMPSTANKSSVNVMKIVSTFEHSDELDPFIKKYINYSSDLIGYYGYLNYNIYGNNKSVKLIKISDSDFSPDNYSYFEVPTELKNANKIDLIILIRGSKYTFNLK